MGGGGGGRGRGEVGGQMFFLFRRFKCITALHSYR